MLQLARALLHRSLEGKQLMTDDARKDWAFNDRSAKLTMCLTLMLQAAILSILLIL